MKQIYYLNDKDQILNEVKKQNKIFFLEEFFLEKDSYLIGGLQMITPRQFFSCYTDSSHILTLKKLIYSIYGEDKFNEIWNDKKDMEELACGLGCILFQVIYTELGYSFVWIPEVINSFQYEKLCEISSEMKRINKISGDKKFILGTNIVINGEFLELDDALPYIKERVVSSVPLYDEEIVSDDVNDLSVSLKK